MKKKVKFNVKIDVYGNGAGVIIKSKDKTQSRVFEGKDYIKRYTDWIDEVCKEEIKTKPVMGGIRF